LTISRLAELYRFRKIVVQTILNIFNAHNTGLSGNENAINFSLCLLRKTYTKLSVSNFEQSDVIWNSDGSVVLNRQVTRLERVFE
jgi:hypothetical protein